MPYSRKYVRLLHQIDMKNISIITMKFSFSRQISAHVQKQHKQKLFSDFTIFSRHMVLLTINVRLILKVRDIIVFLRDKFQIMHFRGIF